MKIHADVEVDNWDSEFYIYRDELESIDSS